MHRFSCYCFADTGIGPRSQKCCVLGPGLSFHFLMFLYAAFLTLCKGIEIGEEMVKFWFLMLDCHIVFFLSLKCCINGGIENRDR